MSSGPENRCAQYYAIERSKTILTCAIFWPARAPAIIAHDVGVSCARRLQDLAAAELATAGGPRAAAAGELARSSL